MTIKTNGTQKESQVVEMPKKTPKLLHYDIEYDSQKPEETIRNFVSDIRNMLSRYEGDIAKLDELNNQLADIEHGMEIGNYKNVPEGYRMYRKMAQIRRDRRACKNEIDLLWPIYEYFHGTEVLNRLTKLQGDCSKLKDTIDDRVYTVRTDILNEWLEPEKKEKQPRIGLNLLTGETCDMDAPFETYEERNRQAEEAEKKFQLAWKSEAMV